MRISVTSHPHQHVLAKVGVAQATAGGPCRHERADTSATRAIVKTACAGLLVAGLAGCSINSKTAALEPTPELVTASLAKTVKAEGIDQTDAELIRETVVNANDAAASRNVLAWSNPDTGNSGTIMAINRVIGDNGQNCKKFQTTVDSFSGISIYQGQTCELSKDQWVLSDLLREHD